MSQDSEAMMRKFRICMLVINTLLVVVSPPICAAESSGSAKLSYARVGNHIMFPGVDDLASSSGKTLLSFSPKDFSPAAIYRGRLLLAGDKVTSTAQFVLPQNASIVEVVGRGTEESGVFPRFRLTMVPSGGRPEFVLYDGYMASVGLTTIVTKVPAHLRGTQVSLQLKMLNPSVMNDIRTLFLARVDICR